MTGKFLHSTNFQTIGIFISREEACEFDVITKIIIHIRVLTELAMGVGIY